MVTPTVKDLDDWFNLIHSAEYDIDACECGNDEKEWHAAWSKLARATRYAKKRWDAVRKPAKKRTPKAPKTKKNTCVIVFNEAAKEGEKQ